MKTSKPYTLPAGTYFVGDPCYCFDDHDRWMKLLESSNYFEGDRQAIQFESEHYVAAFGTMYGDGEYNGFPVDAGLLGCVHESLIEESCKPHLAKLGKMITFQEDFVVQCFEDGTIQIGGTSIFTGDDPYEEVWDDSEYFDDEEDEKE